MSKKYLVITGASKGIGRATAELFLANGYHVVNLSRSEPPLAGISHYPLDLSDASAVDAMGAQLAGELAGAGQIVLLHNAGLLRKDSSDSLAAASLNEVLQVNVTAASQLNAALLPQMQAGSSILYVGSTLAEKAVANASSYVISKHAQLGLMRATCQDLAGKGIHTACVCPGFTETEMLYAHVGGSRDVLDSLAAGNALGRLVEPQEIAETLYFAAQSPVLNGAVIHANLGQLES